MPNATVSTFNVPSDSGIVFLEAREPAIAIGPIIGKYLPISVTVPVAIFQKAVLSQAPQNLNRYLPLQMKIHRASLKIRDRGLFSHPMCGCIEAINAAIEVPTKIKKGWRSIIRAAILTSRDSIFLPRNSGVLQSSVHQ